MGKFINLFSVAFAATLFVQLALSNGSYAEILSQPKTRYANFVGLHSRFDVKQLSGNNVNGTRLYTLSFRIAGDNLVAHSANNQTWPSLQNVSVTFNYPTSGIVKQVTFVRIQVDQSSNLGQAYMIKGDLHQRGISVVVEALTTLYLNYDAQIYGV